MKTFKIICLVLLAVIVITIIGAVVVVMPYVEEYNDTTSEMGEAVVITIPQGASVTDIGEILKENGLIKSVRVFKLKAMQEKNGSKMNYGTFTLHKGMCIPDIINTLAGNVTYRETMTFTVPEGYSVEWIASELEKVGVCTAEEFFKALDDEYDYEFLKDIPENEDARYKLQGYLYPKTYEFYTDATAHEIIDKMLSQFEKEISAIEGIEDVNLHEMLTIASLVEREALLESEFKTISGVIHNRLEKGMQLGIDATIQYAKSDGLYDYVVTREDYTEYESPYSTYKIPALPPGPICNPSVGTIEAAINPEEHEYYYYHTDNDKKDGSHIFSKTEAEHRATL